MDEGVGIQSCFEAVRRKEVMKVAPKLAKLLMAASISKLMHGTTRLSKTRTTLS